MPDYPISEEALEAANGAQLAHIEHKAVTGAGAAGDSMRIAINAFLAAEGFEVEQAVPRRIVGRKLTEGWDGNGPRPQRLVGPWRPAEGQ